MTISVVIPTYNRGHMIMDAIQSVMDQTLSPLEIIIVDDFSTDQTREVVESIRDERIKYVLNSRLKGANGARNTGILMAEGNYIAFQDSDDIWLPNKLEEQMRYLEENSNIDMCFCSLDFNHGAKTIPARKVDHNEMEKQLKKGNFISTQTIIIKKEVAQGELFDEKLMRFQDWDFCIRVAEKYVIGHLATPLVLVEQQNDSISKKVNGKEALEQFFGKHPDVATELPIKAMYQREVYEKASREKQFATALKSYLQFLTYKVIIKTSGQRNTI
ncbi:glycosyltransferase family 2 protein [Litchfieldia salsa]|uniref:Glycosyl transferase family 2 n=1 Tax=Litchfieldia salsa TaxID=930152 RepID=A0A1H0WVX8_9BACI|nr:glycosyltransferase family A protein [Litchfieldia salsa]SDP94924.1 Glycosyl transferase family 2 [Litchfieldia salsa]